MRKILPSSRTVARAEWSLTRLHPASSAKRASVWSTKQTFVIGGVERGQAYAPSDLTQFPRGREHGPANEEAARETLKDQVLPIAPREIFRTDFSAQGLIHPQNEAKFPPAGGRLEPCCVTGPTESVAALGDYFLVTAKTALAIEESRRKSARSHQQFAWRSPSPGLQFPHPFRKGTDVNCRETVDGVQ